jgi:hypothetical protein
MAAEAPDYGAITAVDLEDCGDVAAREQVMPVVAFGDGVDVEVVPRCRAIVTRTREPCR